MDRLAAELLLNSCFSDTVFVTLFRTAVETAVSEVHKLLGTGGGPHLLSIDVLAVADGLFGLYGSTLADSGLGSWQPLWTEDLARPPSKADEEEAL